MNNKPVELLAQCYLVRCSKKTGKVDTCLEGMGYAMLNLWALQNTTKTKETFVFEKATGYLIEHCTGSDSGFPEVERWTDENIEDYFPGILEKINK